MFDNEKQAEQALLSLWHQAKRPALYTVILCLVCSVIYSFYNVLQAQKLQLASTLYYSAIPLLKEKESDVALKQIHDLQTQYPQTIYASLASLEASKYHIDHKAFDAAANQLDWVVTKGAAALKPLATLRLARLYLEQNTPKKTIDLLDHSSSTDIESALIKGYAYLALQSPEQAFSAFKQAKDSCEKNSDFALCDQVRMQYNNLNYVR